MLRVRPRLTPRATEDGFASVERACRFKWPTSTRTLAVKTALVAAGDRFAMGQRGGYIVVLGNPQGAEISPTGDGNWLPMNVGSIWPNAHGVNKRGRATGGLWLRRNGGGSGSLVLARYETEEDARIAGVLAAGPGGAATGTVQAHGFFTDRITIAAAAAEYVPQAGTISVTLTMDESVAGPAFIAETAAKAGTAADRYRIAQGASVDVEVDGANTSIWTIGTAGEFLSVVEHTL